MKVVYTEAALGDLDDILTFVASDYPVALEPLKERLRMIETRIGRWPRRSLAK